MTESQLKYLSDIVYSIGLIEQFMLDVTSYEQFQSDLKTRSAVERQLVIIGEAVNKFNQSSLTPITDARQIIGLRNRLVHAYDAIDCSILWVITKNHLTNLKIEAEQLLTSTE